MEQVGLSNGEAGGHASFNSVAQIAVQSEGQHSSENRPVDFVSDNVKRVGEMHQNSVLEEVLNDEAEVGYDQHNAREVEEACLVPTAVVRASGLCAQERGLHLRVSYERQGVATLLA